MAQQVRRGDVSTISAVIVPSRSSPLHTYDLRYGSTAFTKGVQGSFRLCRQVMFAQSARCLGRREACGIARPACLCRSCEGPATRSAGLRQGWALMSPKRALDDRHPYTAGGWAVAATPYSNKDTAHGSRRDAVDVVCHQGV